MSGAVPMPPSDLPLRRLPRRLAGVLFALLLVACAPEPAPDDAPADATVVAAPDRTAMAAQPVGDLEAVALELGSRLDADGRVAEVQERFRPSDTVQVSLITVGSAPTARLRVEWRDAEGRVLASDEQSIAPTGPAVHRFSRAVEGGWPPGRYAVEVHLDAASAGVREFDVR